MNDDIWESAFKPALSGGLQDRLGELEIRLEPLDEAAMASLLETRNPGRGSALHGRLSLQPGERYARLVLRRAAEIEDVHESVMPAAVAPAVAQEASGPRVEAVVAEPAPPHVGAVAGAPVAESETPVAIPPVEAETEALGETPPPVTTGEFTETAIHPEESPFSAETLPAAAAPASTIEATPGEPEPSGFAAIESPVEPEAAAAGGGDRIDDLLRQFRERYGRE